MRCAAESSSMNLWKLRCREGVWIRASLHLLMRSQDRDKTQNPCQLDRIRPTHVLWLKVRSGFSKLEFSPIFDAPWRTLRCVGASHSGCQAMRSSSTKGRVITSRKENSGPARRFTGGFIVCVRAGGDNVGAMELSATIIVVRSGKSRKRPSDSQNDKGGPTNGSGHNR